MEDEQAQREAYEKYGELSESPETDYPSENGCGGYFYIFLGIAVVFLLISVWRYFGLVGTFAGANGQLNIYNEANVELDIPAIEASAQKLRENFDLDIDIYIVQSTENLEPLSPLQSHFNRVNFDTILPNNLVIVIGIDEQYSEISWGANLNRLDGERLRSEVLNPRLNERDYTGALINTFDASTETLQNGNLAFGELLRGFGEYTDEVLIVGAVLGLFVFVFYLQSQGLISNEGSDSSYSGWRSSSSSSSRSSSSSSSSSGRSGGSSRGSWKD